MERLIKDASELDEIQKELGVTVDANSLSFANIVNAISVMQSKMGIAGATAAEAATTISGSLGMMKAAWSNLIVGLSDDTADFDGLMDKMVKSATIAFNNILPRARTAINGIGKLINELVPVVIEQLPELAEDIIPAAIEGLLSIVNAVADNAPDLLGVVWETIKEQSPVILATAKSLTLDLLKGLAEGIPEALPEITEFIADLADTITDPQFLTKIGETGDNIMGAIADGMAESVYVLIEKAPKIAGNILAAIWQAITAKFRNPKELLKDLGQNFVTSGNPAANLAWNVGERLITKLTGGNDEEFSELEDAENPPEDIEWSMDIPEGASSGTLSTTINGAEININVAGTSSTAEEIAEAVSEALQQMTDRSLAAYG